MEAKNISVIFGMWNKMQFLGDIRTVQSILKPLEASALSGEKQSKQKLGAKNATKAGIGWELGRKISKSRIGISKLQTFTPVCRVPTIAMSACSSNYLNSFASMILLTSITFFFHNFIYCWVRTNKCIVKTNNSDQL